VDKVGKRDNHSTLTREITKPQNVDGEKMEGVQ
jgi:hypothetical protein